jgi:hypothetical protein
MKRKSLLVTVSIAVGLLFLSTGAMAVPLEGTYSTSDGTLKAGLWKEIFPGGVGSMGTGGSQLIAYSLGGLPYQWYLDMTSDPASLYGGGAPTNPSIASTWNYQTAYHGTITIGGSLTDSGTAAFIMDAINYNVTYGAHQDDFGRNLLEWKFVGYGTYDGYTMDVSANYVGAPFPISANPFTFGDTASSIQMEMEIKGPAPVPEPATMLLLGSGLVGLAAAGRRKFFKK